MAILTRRAPTGGQPIARGTSTWRTFAIVKSPVRAARGKFWLPFKALQWGIPVSRGLHPWLLANAPLGLRRLLRHPLTVAALTRLISPCWISVGLVFGSMLLPLSGQDRKSETVQPQPVAQPIAFSHKLHMQLGLHCKMCHRTAQTASSAGFPDVSDCMICHGGIAVDKPDVRKLARYSLEKKSIPWVRIYRVPYYVFFSHQNHRQARIDCSTCHGVVSERDVLWKEKDISMEACVTCHRRQEASTECHLCHALDQ